MSKDSYKKKKKESFFTKFFNTVLTLVLAGVIATQVSCAANNNLRIAQISDAHFSSFEKDTSYKFLEKSPELLDDAIFQINTSGPYDFVMFTGDLINQPMVSELENFLTHTDKLIYPWYALPGNHDIAIDGELNKKKFIEVLANNNDKMKQKNIYYAFTPKKGFRVICLDSIIDYKLTSNGEIREEEFNWLKDELKNHPNDVLIICTHVPIIEPYPSSNHKMNNEYEVRKLIKSFKKPVIVLQGHYHGTKIIQNDNLLVVASPSLVTFPNAFRVININSHKNKVLVDVFLKETNMKELQSRSKIRVFGTSVWYGEENDRNASFELERNE